MARQDKVPRATRNNKDVNADGDVDDRDGGDEGDDDLIHQHLLLPLAFVNPATMYVCLL